MANTRQGAAVVTAAVLSGYAMLHWLGRNAGTTRAERSAELPGDDLVGDPIVATTHAITIDAPPLRVWPWLIQMGWHQGGWYTAEWVDRLLFPRNWPSADRIIPDLQHRTVGDRIPDGPPDSGCDFVVVALAPNQHLVLRSRTHLPPSWPERYGAWIDWSWAFVLRPLDGARTRFVFRSRCRLGPWWVAAGYWLAMVPADFVMARQMLRGVKSRAERTPAQKAARREQPSASTPTATAPVGSPRAAGGRRA